MVSPIHWYVAIYYCAVLVTMTMTMLTPSCYCLRVHCKWSYLLHTSCRSLRTQFKLNKNKNYCSEWHRSNTWYNHSSRLHIRITRHKLKKQKKNKNELVIERDKWNKIWHFLTLIFFFTFGIQKSVVLLIFSSISVWICVKGCRIYFVV